MSSIRVLHLVPSVAGGMGGLATVALKLSRYQRNLGVDARIWCFDSPQVASSMAKEEGLEGCIVPFSSIGPKQLMFSPKGSKAIRSLMGTAFDLLHLHGLWLWTSKMTSQWRESTGKPTIVSTHGMLEPNALTRGSIKKRIVLRLWEGKNLRDASCLHATSSSEAANIRAFCSNNPIALIPNGVPEECLEPALCGTAFRKQFGIPPERRLWLFLSRIHPIKGLPMLLGAMSNLREELREWLLIVAGNDELSHRSELETLVKIRGLEKWVRFVGPLYGNDKANALSCTELFVLPTRSENFSIAVAEALAAGKPVLTTKGAPWAEIEKQQCGWWVDANGPAIEIALRHALGLRPSELTCMGARGRELIRSKYLWSQVAKQFEEVYVRLIRGNMNASNSGAHEFKPCDS